MKKWMLIKAGKFILFAAAAGIVFGNVVVWLWNALIPEIFHANTINFWQGIGLLVLARLLFGGFGHRWGGHRWKGGSWKQRLEEKVVNMTPEEREEYLSKWKRHCGYKWEHDNKKEEPAN